MPTLVKPHPTGLVAPTATTALGASRALTSHLRNYYRACYQGRCPRPRLTFALDMGLLAAVIVLMSALLWIVRMPALPAGVAVSVTASPVQSGDVVPFVATVRSIDGKTHHDVRLQWRLPQGAQMLDAHPPFTADNGAYLGDVEPGRDVLSRAFIRFYLPPGENADVGFSVLYDDNGLERQYTATDRRPVVGAVLTADVPEPFRDVMITEKGTVVPIRVTNRSAQPIPSVFLTVRLNDVDTDVTPRTLGDLLPGASRFIFVPVQAIDGIARVTWSVGAASREFSSGSWEASVTQSAASFPRIAQPLRARPEQPLRVSVSDASAGDALIIVHPLLSEPVRRISLEAGASQPDLPAPSNATGTNHEWMVVPVTTAGNNRPLLGPVVMGVTSVALPFRTEIRYVSSAGDQLGAGPNPPQAGIETRYWAFFTIGPVDNALENISVEATLAPGVFPTGNVSGPDGGSFNADGRHIRWTLGALDAANGVSSKAVFGFEIRVTPRDTDIGQAIPLIGSSVASAEDTQTTVIFEGEDAPKTSVLPEDARREQAGIVQPSP